MSQDNNVLTPVGRIVQGDVFKGTDTDAEGRPLVIKNGPNAGQPRTEFFIAVAIPKTDPEVGKLIQSIHAAAQASFPAMFDSQGNCTNPRFAFKYTDGDSTTPNTKGVAPCTREGFAGHYVFNFSSGFAPKAYNSDASAQIVNSEEIKRGYYVRVYANIRGNGSQQQAGVFINHSMVQLVGYGEEIVSGPSGADIFGSGSAPVLPAGASATPLAPPATIAAPVLPAGASATPLAPAVPAPVAPSAPAAVPAAPIVPAHDFVTPPVAPVIEPKYVSGGVEYTREQLLAAGWSDVQIATLPTA